MPSPGKKEVIGATRAGRRYGLVSSGGPAYQTQPLAQWSPTSCGPKAREGFSAAPVNGPPNSTPIEIVRPIASPATALNGPRVSTAAPNTTSTRKNVKTASSRKPELASTPWPSAGTPSFTASVVARGSRSRTSSAASAAPPNCAIQ